MNFTVVLQQNACHVSTYFLNVTLWLWSGLTLIFFHKRTFIFFHMWTEAEVLLWTYVAFKYHGNVWKSPFAFQVLILLFICIISIFLLSKNGIKNHCIAFQTGELRDRSCKMNILSSFIDPHVVPSLTVKFSSVPQESLWMKWVNDDRFAIFRWTIPLSPPWSHTYPKMDFTEVYNFSVSAVMYKYDSLCDNHRGNLPFLKLKSQLSTIQIQIIRWTHPALTCNQLCCARLHCCTICLLLLLC